MQVVKLVSPWVCVRKNYSLLPKKRELGLDWRALSFLFKIFTSSLSLPTVEAYRRRKNKVREERKNCQKLEKVGIRRVKRENETNAAVGHNRAFRPRWILSWDF